MGTLLATLGKPVAIMRWFARVMRMCSGLQASARYATPPHVAIHICFMHALRRQIGFNAGHSYVVLLSAVEEATAASNEELPLYHGFDLGHYFTNRAVAAVNSSVFPARLRLHLGNSEATIPALLAREPNLRCDALSLDGDHAAAAIRRDWAALRRVVRPGAPVLIDDVGGDYAVRGARSSIARQFLNSVVGTELELFGCVRLPGIADGHLLHDAQAECARLLANASSMHPTAYSAALRRRGCGRVRNVTRLIASDGFCVARALGGERQGASRTRY